MTDDDLALLRTWIGRTDRSEDVIAPELARRFRATFNETPDAPKPGDPAPLAIHWCLSPAVATASELGPDGHPSRGGFLPPVTLPRRMWAGGELTLLDPLRVGDKVNRLSRIANVEAKAGRTGPLCFVTVEHEHRTDRGPAIRERQDIVYRDAATGPAPSLPASDITPGPHVQPFPTDSTLLFRYSALTFNGHRIHYDRDYARDEEGYADLVVHGPLQATVLLRLASAVLGSIPARFDFRGLSALMVGPGARLDATETSADELALRVIDAAGRVTMAATAHR